MLPVSFDGCCNLFAGDFYSVAYVQAGKAYYNIWFVVVGSRYVDAADIIFAGSAGLEYRGRDYLAALCKQRTCKQQQERQKTEAFRLYIFHFQ